MRVPVPIRVHADFECIPKVLFKQNSIAVGFYLISRSFAPFGEGPSNCYYSYFDESCVTWFVHEMLTLEKIASEYFEKNIPLQMTPEEESFNNLPYDGFAKIHLVIRKAPSVKKFEIMIT